jgi:hypothetical protein
MHTKFLSEKSHGKDQLVDLGVVETIMVKRILEK